MAVSLLLASTASRLLAATPSCHRTKSVQRFQLTDDLTKIYSKHTFKMGFEWQHVKFSTLQPPWSRGEFDFNGNFTEIPTGVSSGDQGNTGRAAFLLTPVAAQNGGTVDFVGGSTNIYASNISLTDNGKNYYGTYFNDDWKVTPKLTVNLGLRWDFFGLVFEHHGAQANFVPGGAPTGSPLYLLPGGSNPANLSASFLNLLSADGIGLDITNNTAKGWAIRRSLTLLRDLALPTRQLRSWWYVAALACSLTDLKTADFHQTSARTIRSNTTSITRRPNDGTPHSFAGCAAAAPYGFGTATFESGFACTPLDPTAS